MIAKHIKSRLRKQPYYQDVECLQLKKLTVCFERQQEMEIAVSHVAYDNPDLDDELRRCKHQVTVSEQTLPVEEEAFNELDFVCYSTDGGDIFLFSSLAVRGNEHCRIDTYCKEDLTIEDAAAYWGIDIKNGSLEVSYECHIPQNQCGDTAITLDRLMYRSWDMVLRAPGEVYSAEDRLKWIEFCQKDLADGRQEFLNNFFEEIRAILEDYLLDRQSRVKEDTAPPLKQHYMADIQSAESLLQELKTTEKELQEKWPLA